MRIVYSLLSPTFGMHQYTADLANHQVASGEHDVHLVTTRILPADRYGPQVHIHTPISTRGTGFALEGLDIRQLGQVKATIAALRPDVVHITGVHLWNVHLVRWLAGQGVPCIHTLHDLDPHLGVRFGGLIRLWNRLILDSGCHILVHGRLYRDRLLAMGLSADRIAVTPLLHLFLSYAGLVALREDAVEYQPWGLFFGRLERYKGIAELLTAETMLPKEEQGKSLVLAGPGSPAGVDLHTLSPRVEVRNRLIQDAEAVDLFQRCGVLVLPYLDATQSALVAAAYYFKKPVIVTRTGALPEYVQEGISGWVVPPGDPAALAACLEGALADPARLQRLGSAGRAWYDDQRRCEAHTLRTMYESAVAAAR
jgi:glycosyltransferase involved in cell wall biosynthesis